MSTRASELTFVVNVRLANILVFSVKSLLRDASPNVQVLSYSVQVLVKTGHVHCDAGYNSNGKSERQKNRNIRDILVIKTIQLINIPPF